MYVMYLDVNNAGSDAGRSLLERIEKVYSSFRFIAALFNGLSVECQADIMRGGYFLK